MIHEETVERVVYADDYPGEANSGLLIPGISHLERFGFREGDKVRVTIKIERAEFEKPD